VRRTTLQYRLMLAAIAPRKSFLADTISTVASRLATITGPSRDRPTAVANDPNRGVLLGTHVDQGEGGHHE
jgi:hypothetical protein